MKKVILLFLFATSLIASQAQVKVGGKAGANISGLVGDDADDFKSKLGLNIGVFVEVPVAPNFSAKPEIMLSGQGAKFEDDVNDAKFAFNYLNIPLLGKYTSTSGFFAETGPQIGFLLSAKAKTDDVDVNVKDSFKGLDFGWAFGIGYQLAESGFGVNARYNLGLSNVADDDDDDDASIKNSVFQIGVFKTLNLSAISHKK